MARVRSSSAPADDEREPDHGQHHEQQPSQPSHTPVSPPIFLKEATELTEDGLSHSPAPRPVHNPGNEAPENWYEYFKKHHDKKQWAGPGHRSSTVGWHDKWDEHDWSNGRVLVIDYCRPDAAHAGKTRILAQEIGDVHGLHKYYMTKKAGRNSALRVIHVQNAPWAVQYLLRKYNTDGGDDLTEMGFGKWARFSRPEWRAGRPLLKGKTWRTQRDPYRGIRRTAFGLDYLGARDIRADDGASSHEANSIAARSPGGRVGDDNKMMEMNCYDEADAPAYGWDVCVQRLSCYIQFKEGEPASLDDFENPYAKPTLLAKKGQHQHQQYKQADGQASCKPGLEEKSNEDVEAKKGIPQHKPWFPPMQFVDNSNTIIVFEDSLSGSVTDTLIAARQQIENRWRRLAFYLPPRDLTNESRLALELMDLILEDIFKALGTSWEHFLGIAETHVAILEDKIYESPADESRAPELWYNSSAWLKVERLAFIHLECVKELITQLGDLPVLEEDGKPWLEGLVDQFEKLTTLVQEDLVKPTTNLSDLMYKSVGIRDSRQSLGLSTSMWRLSWITFIFLPLTFIVGFFGMNVDIFQDNPSIKWYFVAAVPLMLLVLIFWYVLKHALAARHQTPYQKGIFEHMYHDLAVEHPDLWSRAGPRRNIRPEGWWDAVRWWLLRRWFDPRRTIAKPPADPDEDVGGSGLGTWARTKRLLARRWLGSIKATRRASISESEAGLMELPAIDALIATSTPVMAAEVPDARRVTRQNLERLSPPPGRVRSGSPKSSRRPSSSGDSSGVMVDEREFGDSQAESGTPLRRSIDGVLYNHRPDR